MKFDIINNIFSFSKSKNFLIIYMVFITITFLSTLSYKNIAHPKFELVLFFIVLIIGILCINYYFNHNSSKELYKFAFVAILLFGIMCALIVPISDVSDEPEHFTRAEITSQGVLIPHWTGYELGVDRLYNLTEGEFSNELNKNAGFESIASMDFFYKNRECTVFNTSHDLDKINYTITVYGSAFEQNPFYGYLPQAVGIFIAKLFDLNVIWMLWLGRICNLICYAGLVSYAIKKVNCFKIPLLAVACIPITIYQAASMSIDSLIFGLGILLVAYFINLCTSKDNSINEKQIIVFSILSLLMGLCKLPYLAFVFLLLFVPKEKYNNKNMAIVIFSCIFLVALIGVLYSSFSTAALMHSWRSSLNLINPEQQLNFLLNNPLFILDFLHQIFTHDLSFIANGVFNFYNGIPGSHYKDHYYLITILLQAFLTIILFTYPENIKFNFKTRFGTLGVVLLIYIGTCFIQLLTWSYVGELNLGISLRYFIPLVAMLPIIFKINYKFDDIEKFNDYSIIFIIAFLATLILAFATKYY